MHKNLLIWIFVVLVGTTSPLSHASEPPSDSVDFTELVVTTSATHLILFGVIANAFSEEMVSGLKSGIPIDFSFFVELLEKDGGKDKEMLVKTQFRHTLTYDTLKDNYKVELEELSNKITPYPELSEAQRAMSEVNGAQIIELAKLAPNRTYKLRIRADLFKQTLPLSLHHILPFVSWWDRETDWHTLEFNY
ncbi:DUF4390 domain-containing protein [Desulfopila aestuarii]|nr:DUF4390 domain-containing protein [Desulfopila aestuarii]